MQKASEHYRARIDRVIDYIRTHTRDTISLEQLAEVACYSPYHFHRVFRAVTGETVKAFSNRDRCEKAARLLRFSHTRISDIALACGFSSASTLTRLFSQYFGVSPGAYRKGSEIKNSKIGKDLFPVDAYHCEQEFSVTIRQLPERQIAYIRVTDAFREGVVLQAFEQLTTWAGEMQLLEDETIFGMSPDDPEVTPKAKYRYEACITLPAGFRVSKDAPVETMRLPACKYAVTRVSGDLILVGQAFNYLFDRWLINSAYECDLQPGIEVFLDKEHIGDWAHFELDIMIPVKALTR
ncbi:AraC family transcriptional regulator [Mucilaginibacter gynuensis]|uniref:AraC family transcriptional regulator n=1 Tax=Mucilaginibacter gynuensis TaxID=1302236 RepID=A0ABP8GM25_9SPHI